MRLGGLYKVSSGPGEDFDEKPRVQWRDGVPLTTSACVGQLWAAACGPLAAFGVIVPKRRQVAYPGVDLS